MLDYSFKHTVKKTSQLFPTWGTFMAILVLDGECGCAAVLRQMEFISFKIINPKSRVAEM